MWKCPKCQSEIEEDEVVNCWSCDYSKVEIRDTEAVVEGVEKGKADKKIVLSKIEMQKLIKSKQKTGKGRMIWGTVVFILGFVLVSLMPPPRYRELSHIIGFLFIPVSVIMVGLVMYYGGKIANRRALAELREGKVG